MKLPDRYLELKAKDFDTLNDGEKLFVLNWDQYCRTNGLREDQAAKLSAITKQVVNALTPVVTDPADPANPPDAAEVIEPRVISSTGKKAAKKRKQRSIRPTPIQG